MNKHIKNRISGQALIEFLLVLPIFIFTFTIIIDLANIMHCQTTLSTQCVQAVQKGTIILKKSDISQNKAIEAIYKEFWKLKSNIMDKQNYNIPNLKGYEPENKILSISSTYEVKLLTPLFSSLIGESNKKGYIKLYANATAIK